MRFLHAYCPELPTHFIPVLHYERTSRSGGEEGFMKPLRQEVTGLAHGRVLEIGAGNGLNFAFYHPDIVERVEAIEPDSIMLGHARKRASAAPVLVHLVQAPVENLPFLDESFENAVATLVFCSVNDPLRGLSEVRRVLKPGGALLMVEHVRARGTIAATMQNIVTLSHGWWWETVTGIATLKKRFLGRIQDRAQARSHVVRVAVCRVMCNKISCSSRLSEPFHTSYADSFQDNTRCPKRSLRLRKGKHES